MLNDPSATSTTITISGSVPDDSVVTKFMVQWHRDTSVGCSDEDEDSVTEDGDFRTNSTYIWCAKRLSIRSE